MLPLVSACITAALHACLHRILRCSICRGRPALHSAVQGKGWREWTQHKSRGRHHSHLKNMPLLLCFLWMQLCCTALPCLYPSLPIASLACMERGTYGKLDPLGHYCTMPLASYKRNGFKHILPHE